MSAARRLGSYQRSRRQRIAAGAVLATTGLISTYITAIRPQPTYATPNSKDPVQAGGTGWPGALLQPRNGSTPSCQGLTPVTNASALAAAITAANNTQSTETICIDGTITLQSALPTITSSVTLVGTDRASDKIVVDAAYKGTVGTILEVNMSLASQALEIAHLGFEGGLANTVVGQTVRGGAIALTGSAAALSVTDSAFTGNYAPGASQAGQGGAIAWQGSVSLTGTSLLNNTAGKAGTGGGSSSRGGALWVQGGDVTIHSTTFTSNATDSRGGAVYISGGSATITTSVFTQNKGLGGGGATGGAVSVRDLTGDLVISDSTFTSNSSDGNGGAIYSRNDLIDIDGSTFTSNIADYYGGAVTSWAGARISTTTFSDNSTDGAGGAAYLYGDVTVSGSTFSDNRADKGGGLYHWGPSYTFELEGTTFVGNDATVSGGAVHVNSGSFSATQVSMTDNSADVGAGAIHVKPHQSAQPNVALTNSFIGSNSSASGAGGIQFTGTGALSLTFSSVYDNTTSSAAASEIVMTGGSLTAKGSVVASSSGTANIALNSAAVTGQYSVSTDQSPVFIGTGSRTVSAGTLQFGGWTGTAAGQRGRAPASSSVLVTGAPTSNLGTGVNVDQLETTRSGIWTIGARQVAPAPPAPPEPTGGGGGAAAPTETPTPSPTPTATATQAPIDDALGLIDSTRNPNLPAGGLPPGGSLLLVGGQPVPVTVAPNSSRNATGLSISATGWDASLVGRGDTSDPLGLTPKSALIFESQQVAQPRSLSFARKATVAPVAQASGTGFKASSPVKFYVLPSTYMGELQTDASGSFNGTLPVPAGLPAGNYTLQMNGLAPSGEVRSLNLGIVVREASTAAVRTVRASTSVLFARNSAELTWQGKAKLRALVKRTGKDAVRVTSVGFVQRSDSSNNDQTLSTARARAVSAYLRELGVRGAYVVRGNGVGGPTAADRKVEVTVTYQARAKK